MQSRIAALLVVLFAIPLTAQLPTASERIQVTLVEVPVNVVDRSGAAVRGLKQENFELYDNGQRRAITHFDMIDLAPGVKRESAGLTGAAASRNFLLLFDMNSSSPGTLNRAREAARNFIKSSGVSGDRIAVGTFSAEQGFRLMAAFTTDMKLVSTAIEALGSPRMFQPADPLLLSSVEMRAMADDVEGRGTTNSANFAEDLRAVARSIDRAANDVQRQFISRTLDGYSDVAHLLNRVPGRKQVILLSEGFDAKLIHGREALSSSQAMEERRLIERGDYAAVDNDNRYGNAQSASDLQEMINACRRSDVVLHAIDIKGLRTSGEIRDTTANVTQKSNESLFLLTHDTGGMVFKNANSIDEDFGRLLRAEEVVYVLGFEAPSSSPGKFHDLKVKLVNVPSARTMHRTGYFESSPAGTAIERTLTAGEIIVNQLPETDLRVRTLVTPFPRREGRAQVPVIVEIDGPSMLKASKGGQIQSELFIYAFDDKGMILDFVHQPIGLDLAKLRDRLQHRGVRVYETLMLPPGHYSIRTLVRAGAQSLYGYSGADVEVPAWGQAAVLGGSAIDDNPAEWVPVKPPDRAGVPRDYPFLIGGAMVVPAAAPVLRPGVSARLGLYVGNVTADHVDVAATVGGKETPVKVAAQTVGSDGTARLLLDFVPPALPPGDYILTLRVPESKSMRNMAEVRFAVR
ncbi:MAG TPA: VWA domain-containing protein [Thermoanaerobaculia bacterium]|nr:VWA domain-containing protein [Thermoanaerobaculia bacterium]